MGVILDIIKMRRSQRDFLPDELPGEVLDEIIEAGRYAPTGGNAQSTHFIVITQKSVLDALRKRVYEGFLAIEDTDDLYFSIKNNVKKAHAGAFDFSHGAPVLVLVANRAANRNGMADDNIAATNIMLQATELGVGSCYVSQVRWLLELGSDLRSYLETLGLSGEETVNAAVALGYARNPVEAEPKERTGMCVTVI